MPSRYFCRQLTRFNANTYLVYHFALILYVSANGTLTSDKFVFAPAGSHRKTNKTLMGPKFCVRFSQCFDLFKVGCVIGTEISRTEKPHNTHKLSLLTKLVSPEMFQTGNQNGNA